MKILSMTLFFCLSLFSFNFSSAQDAMYDICPLKVGQELPNPVLEDQNGTKQELKSLIGDKTTVLIFYRGAWCGYCIQHLAELNDIKEEVESLGIQMLGITVDKAEKLDISAEKSESEIPVYSDTNLEALKGFGLDWRLEDSLYNKYKSNYNLDLEEWSGSDHHSLPVPSIYIVNDTEVLFQYVNPNYRRRLKAETLLAILKTL